MVAGEVRQLACRSATVAKEISSLIRHSAQTVAIVATAAEQAGLIMQDAQSAVTQSHELMLHMVQAPHEQTEKIGSITSEIMDIDGGTQKNSSLFGEPTAVVNVLSGQAEILRPSIARFHSTRTGPNPNGFRKWL